MSKKLLAEWTKIVIFAIMATSALFVVLVIGPRLKKKKVAKPVATGDLSLAELASFNGREGHPAYFAYKGKIYDASVQQRFPGRGPIKVLK